MANPDLVQSLYRRTATRRPVDPSSILQRPDDTAVTPGSLGETFGRGFDAGIESIRTDTDYFKGLFNTVTGDDEAAQVNIQNARAREARIAESLSGLEDFGEFVENPSLEGLLSQSAKMGGQLAPYLLTTIASGGSGAAASLIGKGALSAGSRVLAKRVIQDSIERTIKDEATPSERDLAELAYRAARQNVLAKSADRLTAKGGAITGQLAEEFTLQAGANFGENLTVDGLSDQEAAYRALAIAAPQAVVGVAGERIVQNAIFKNLANIAKERGTDGSMLAQLGKEVAQATGRGAVGETAAEVTQEGLQVAARLQADPTFTREDALLRLGEAAFGGALGGGAVAGGGRATTGALTSTGNIMRKAGEFIEQARMQQVNARYNEEQYGLSPDGNTTQEPQSHINAQIRSLLDEATERDSVWIAGDTPAYNASTDVTKPVEQVDIEGQTFHMKFVPGRGTIISRDPDLVRAVVEAEASDESLKTALKYSNTKPIDADVVIEARDKEGNVVWSEATNEAGVNDAYAAAVTQVPEGGQITRQSIEGALEERAKLVRNEQGPQVRNIDFTDEQRAEMDAWYDANPEFREDTELEAVDPVEDDSDPSPIDMGEAQMVVPDPVNLGTKETYTPRKEGKIYEKTQELRDKFARLFNPQLQSDGTRLGPAFLGKDEYTDIDFNDPDFEAIPDTLLNQAIKAKEADPEADIYIEKTEDGYKLLRQPREGEQTFGFDTRQGETEEEASPRNLREAVLRAIKVAASSEWASKYQTKSKKNKGWVAKKDSQKVKVDGRDVNLIDLVKEGQRISATEERTTFTQGGESYSQRQGFIRIMGQLLADGHTVTIGGQNITQGLITQVEYITDALAAEEAALADALLEAGMDVDDVSASRIDELLQSLEEAQADKLVSNIPGQDALAQLVQERRRYNREYAAAMRGGEASPDIPRSPILQLLDIPAGFKDGKVLSLGKILLARSDEAKPADRTYEVLNERNSVVFSGDRQQVIEFLDNTEDSDQLRVTRPERTRIDGTLVAREEVNIQEEPSQGDEGEMGYVPDMNEFDPESGYAYSANWAQPGNDAPKKKIFGLKNSTVASKILNSARRVLKLDKAVSVFNIDTILSDDTVTQGEYRQLFKDPRVADYIRQIAQELRDEPDSKGRYVGFADAHIILVNPAAEVNALETGLIVGHELGHALFREQLSSTLQNPVLYNRLFRDFEAARDAKGAPAAYQGNRGFEEWYADQTAYWAQKLYLKEEEKEASTVTTRDVVVDYFTFKDWHFEQGKKTYRVKEVKGAVAAHFKKLVKELKEWHTQLSKDLRTRISREAYTEGFDSYMDEVVTRGRRSSADPNVTGAQAATWQQKTMLRKMAEVQEKEAPGFANKIKEQVAKIIRSDGFTPIYNFMFTADSRLRKIAGDKLADLFYSRAQDSKGKGRTRLGFLKSAALEGNAWYSKLEDMIEGDLNSPEVRQAMDEAFSGAKTADLTSENAVAIRNWFDRIYDEYIEPSNTDIGRRDNYAPVVLKLSEIEKNPEALVKLLLAAEPEADKAKIRQAVDKLVSYQHVVMENLPIDIKETDPAASAENAIRLTQLIDRTELQKAGFLEDSDVALLRYTNHIVKRVEWNKHTKDDQGNSIYEEELAKLPLREREEVKKIVHKYLGYNTSPLSPMWRAINSWGSVLQVFAILPLATLGSLPELAGPVIASKEFSSLSVGMKEIFNTIKNREEARQLARDIGVVTSQSVANAMMSQSELEWMDQSARKLTDGFFRVTLLDTYTKFTREFAVNMGVRFIMKHSDSESAVADSPRYLQELGVTAEEVRAWSDSNQDFTTPEGRKVRQALQRFVETSTLRPNAAERPLWASDPHWALAWQLKGFFYSYGKVLLAGAKREASARLEGASRADVNTYAAMTGAAGVFALMGIATMPLAMLGMELREYAKYGLAWAIPGIDHEAKNYFRTDDLTWPQYLSAAFDRSFAAGPVTIASQAMQAADWGRGVTGAAAVVAGPTAETLTRMFTDGFGSTFENRMLPTGLL